MTPPNDDPAALPEERRKAEPIDTRLVRRLADILKDTDLTEIEVARGDLKIRVARAGGTAPAPAPVLAPVAITPAAPPPAPAGPTAVPAPAPANEARGDTVTSPMVGTVYLQPQPGAAAFIKPGDRVAQGQTLVLIEAMKTMNPVAAPRAGTVLDILVGDSQPVEFGEPLVVLE
jgi:acetyl-CoA carboxylase biotin carboxyl carrier protein